MPSGHPPGPSSIIVGNCTACNGLVRVSATAKASAKVRCPHCQEIFPLINLLENVAPEVEVLQSDETVPAKKKELYIDQTAETVKDASGKFVVPSQLAKGARRRKSSRSRSGSSRSRSSSSGSESGRSSRNGQQSPTRSERSSSGDRSRSASRERTREPDADPNRRQPTEARAATVPRRERLDRPQESREHSSNPSRSAEGEARSHRSTRHRDARAAEAIASQGNPAVDFLKVIVGGCLALPVAYLIVMWIFTLDPLGIGRGIGEKVPFLVPVAFRTQDEADVDRVDDVETAKSVGTTFLDDGEDAKTNAYGFDNLNIGSEALRVGETELVN